MARTGQELELIYIWTLTNYCLNIHPTEGVETLHLDDKFPVRFGLVNLIEVGMSLF